MAVRVAVLAVLTTLLAGAAPAAAQAYTIPPDNPFVSTPGARGEIYVYGLRNPFRWSFDRLNGDMFVGDVGQSSWEEITRLPAGTIAGANLGWPCREGLVAGPGNCATPGARDPIHVYPTAGAVVGGYVVRDPDLSAWQGRYVFADAYDSAIRWLDLAAPAKSNLANLSVDNVSSFGEDGLGHLYATSLTDGNVYRLQQVDGTTLAKASIGKFDRPMAVFGPLGDPDQLFVVERGGTLKLRAGGLCTTSCRSTRPTPAVTSAGSSRRPYRPTTRPRAGCSCSTPLRTATCDSTSSGARRPTRTGPIPLRASP